MTHDELATDLAARLRTDRRMVWTNIQLGPSGSPRPDVYAIFKSYVDPRPMAYECKVSAADFRADITAGKWQSYLPYACGVVFAAEAIPQDALLKLLIDGVEREGPRYRARDWNLGQASILKRMGAEVAEYVSHREVAEINLESARRQAERAVERTYKEAERIKSEADFSPQRAELIEVLGLRPGAGRYEIESAIRKLKDDSAEHPALRAHRRFTETIRRALDGFGYKEEAATIAAIDGVPMALRRKT